MAPTELGTGSLQVQMMAKARSQATFDVHKLTSFIYGGPQALEDRRAAWSRVEAVLGSSDTTRLPPQYARTSREDLYQDGLRMGKAAWDDQLEYGHQFFKWITPRYTLCNYSPFGLATTMFGRTIELMGTEEQRQKWLIPTRRGEINGAYAQTELGHGSFVRGLETTATFDVASDCFVLNSPTLTSTKFWPGALGFSATHAIVMAQLVIRKTDYGVHPFVVQLRDQVTGKPTQGIELGDLGPKPSHNQTDNGYARFSSVSIPRFNMLMAHASISPQGEYRRHSNVHPKAAYGCMLSGRSKIIWVCASQLAAAVTIAIRYSTVRQQGSSPFIKVGEEVSGTNETAIFQYRSQHTRLLVQLSRAYAILLASRHSEDAYDDFERRQRSQDFSTMTETHALLAGIKAWATSTASEGAEDARKACGGSGYLVISGLPEIVQSVTVLCTLEGENYVLLQQVARYLAKWAPKLALPSSSLAIPRDLSYLTAPYSRPCDATGAQFLDSDTQLLIFQHRSQRLVNKATGTVHKTMSQGKTLSEACNDHVMLLIAMARAHVEYLVLKAFVDAVAAMDDLPEKRIMGHLRSLFALSAITDANTPYASMFSEDSFLSETQFDDIRTQVNKLLDILVPDAIGLTDAWDFTDAGLGSAIGMKNGDIYETLILWTRQLPINVAARESNGVGRKGWEEYIRPALKPRL